ncbi:MAG: AAA family ATPase, partial [Candidatus Latescibacterota bacterium]
MRPLKLILRAFGPYAGEQAVDFRELGSRSFFLIHGPTGSGKTSILDGLCFALYGVTSGGEREARRMRSDHAGPDTPTEVIFDFMLGNAQYRVYRKPEQERPRLRGGGTTTDPARAVLWRIPDPDAAEGEGTVIEERWGRVTDEMERLLGFKADQFRQVALLPQGKFRDLLMADSGEREKILEVLFQTEIYRRIEEALKEEAKNIQSQVNALVRQKDFILGNAKVESAEALEVKLNCLREDRDRIRWESARLQECEREAQTLLDAAREREKKFVELAGAEMQLAALESRRGGNEQNRNRLERGKRALSLRDIESNLHTRLRERDDALSEKTAAERKQEKALGDKEYSEKTWKKELDREPERETARREHERLSELPEKVKELESAEKERKDKAARAASARAEVQKAEAACVSFGNSIMELRQKYEEKKALAFQEPVFRQKTEIAGRMLKLAGEACNKRKERENAIRERENAFAAHTDREAELFASRRELELLEREWFGGQAAVLAGKLSPGEPCPVCGSREHPLPACYAGELPSESEVNRMRERVRKIEREFQCARDDFQVRNAESSQLESELNQIAGFMGDARDTPVESLQKHLEIANKELQQAEAAQKEEISLQEQLGKTVEDEIRAKESRSAREKELAGANIDLAGAEALLNERRTNIPEMFRNTGAVQKAIREAKEKYDGMVDALNTAKSGFDTTVSSLAACLADLRNSEQTFRNAEDRVKQAEAEFMARLRDAGFTERQDYDNSRVEDREMARLDRDTREFDRELHIAAAKAESARDAVKGLDRPLLEPLENRMISLKADIADLSARTGDIARRLSDTEEQRKELRAVLAEIEKWEMRFQTVGRVAEVANGTNPYRMTFQRFVLATLLDDVLLSATERLHIMSRGRFELRRAGALEDRRRAAGLDLILYDAYTGAERPVSTFSGGESFLASLSLALGLADVVQAYAGGIRLETIFVDEGFGSLDPEALE